MKLQEVAVLSFPPEPQDPDESGVHDDRLRLIFTCCHPALAVEAQVALTLRTLAGLTTAEIARAFLVPEPAMAQRLVRAKRKIRNAGIPYRVPPAHQLPERTGAVLAVVYLLFNEGYAATAGADLVRRSLCDEAIRLARTLVELTRRARGAGPAGPPAPARRPPSRTRRPCRRAVPLDAQDRTAWDAGAIAEGLAELDRALRPNRPGPYQVQAAIVAGHASAQEAAGAYRRAIEWTAVEPEREYLRRRLTEVTATPYGTMT